MDYDEAVGMLSGMQDGSGAIVEIDIDEALGKTREPRQYTADEIERLVRKLDELTTGTAAPEKQEDEKKHRGIGLMHLAYPVEELGANARRNFAQAASELKGALSGIGKNVSEIKAEPQPKHKNILAHLSLQDQISELEKISMGLGSNSFSKDELQIIRDELDGLSKASGKEVPADEFHRNLTDIRNKRLIEVMQMAKASS
ncbi:MAG: hypothetical protein KGI00_04465 [Candidatus Micrarchaeota archaeon]|nr:hypothetical protein [Candidatus Micrarchaeota archaeon]MDE1849953.1 hypothetical protein [Candidatus Micrarchaeota archaeon]